MASASIILVSTDPDIVPSISRVVAGMGCRLRVTDSLEAAGKALAGGAYDALVVQADSPDARIRRRMADGFEFWREPPVLVLAKKGSVKDAVDALRAGARDYLTGRPLNVAALRNALDRILSDGRGDGNESAVPTGQRRPFDEFITADHGMLSTLDTVFSVADTRAPLLIEGESGTGKTLVARVFHEHSARRLGRLQEVNCGALSESLLESELFGHARGPFTSAHRERSGKFELADGGTLLLDDIANASFSLQVRLLRILESGEYERVGGRRTLRTFSDHQLRTIDIKVNPSESTRLARLLSKRVRGVSVHAREPFYIYETDDGWAPCTERDGGSESYEGECKAIRNDR